MDTIRQDIHFAFRSLRKRLLFSLIAGLTLAIGIGGNTAIFSVVNSALLRPLPFPEPERLVKVSLVAPKQNDRLANEDMVWSYPKWEVLRDEQRIFSELAGYSSWSYTLTGEGDPERLEGEIITEEYFRLLGIRPSAGRGFVEEETRDPAKARVVVIGEALWNRRFNRDPNIVGREIRVESGSPVTVVGVIPASFRGLTGRAELWTPVAAMGPEMLSERWSHFMTVVGRLAPAVTLERAQSQTAVLGRRIDERFAAPFGGGAWSATLRSLEQLRIDPNIRRSVLVLFAAVAGVLLIACANVANLLLARAADRRREIAVRLALGAQRRRLVRQLITEALVLATVGGSAGVLVGALGVRVLASLATNATGVLGRVSGYTTVTLASISIDSTVLWFTLAATLLTGVLFGVVPALQATRPNLTVDLKEGATNALGLGRARGLTSRSVLVVLEIAVAFVLLVGSGLMMRSLGRLLSTDAGVDPRNLLTMRITLPPVYAPPARLQFWQQLTERVQTLPGVEQASVTDCPPLSGGCNGTLLWFRDRPPVAQGTEPEVGVHWVSPDYFRTVRAPLKQGRTFEARDREGAPKVVLINETAAQKLFPGENPIGRLVGIGQGGFNDGAEIIGVVADQRFVSMETPAKPDVYISYAQSARGSATLFVRTTVEPTALINSVRKEVQRLDRNLPIYSVMTMEQRVADATARTRVTGLLLAVFAASALLLALVGMYGVIAYAVTQRTREFGLRIALGAGRRNVAALILRYGIAVVGTGMLLGLAGALAATRVLRSMLYEIEPTDPLTFAVLALATALVALAATAAPAVRAMRVDPLTALKSE